MVKSLRPSPEALRRAGWYPASQEAYDKYMQRLSAGVSKNMKRGDAALLPSVKAFKDFVLQTPTVYQEFVRMFEDIDKSEIPSSFDELVHLYNRIFRESLYFGDLGPPLYMIMNRIMNTQGGFSAFSKEVLNLEYKKLFQTWADFLLSGSSTYVLTDEEFPDTQYYGWFHPEARKAMMEYFSGNRSFEQVFICQPGRPHLGFTSFDDFFNRRLACPEIDRPLAGKVNYPVLDNTVVGAPCEALCYHVQHDVKMQDDLFIKDESYSLNQLLYNDPLTEQFVGGTIVQGLLQTPDYHRWHSPVSGRLLRIVEVPGAYFCQAPSTIGDVIPSIDNQKEVPPFLKSLRYFSHVHARKLFFIESNNPKIGLVCFIAIGMTEISTCTSFVYDGQELTRGQELGMFQFGGSSCAIAFNANAQIEVEEKFKPGAHIYINEQLAHVVDE